MLKNLSLIFLLILSASVSAQNNSDSLYFYNQSLNNLNIDHKSNTYLLSNPISKLGSVELFYNNYSGGYKPVQQAQKNTLVGLYTEGINKFGKFTTSGYFGFTKTWQDSLIWSTKGLEEDHQPYYYGSIKSGSFERIKYNLGGNVSYNLIKDKLYIGGGTNFMYNNSTRSTDPRPEVNSYNIIITPEATYRFKNQYVGLKAKWGYGTEETSISFKNNDFKLSTNGYPDRVNYLIMGYGLYKNNQGVSKPLKRLDKYYGLGLDYILQLSALKLKISLNYDNSKEDFYQDLDNSTNRAYVGLYDTDNLGFSLYADHQTKNTNSQLILKYANQNSNDINTIFYAINYRYIQNIGDIKYLIHFNKNEKTSTELGTSLTYKKVEKNDFATDHLVNYSWLEPTISGALYILPNANHKFYMGLEIGYRKPLSSNLHVDASQENLFTNWIVYPDYTFNTSSAYKVSSEFKYITNKILKQFKTGFSAKASYYTKDKVYQTFSTSKLGLGDNLINVNFSFKLYF